MTRFFAWHSLLAAGLFISAFSNAQAAVPESGQLQFSVMREGDKIGTHRIEFQPDGQDLAVDIKTDIAVKVLGITFYRFEHEGHEIWRQNRLISINSETNDDGTPHNLVGIANTDALMIDGDARQASEKLTIIPASLWNHDLITQTELLNTLDGSNMSVTVKEIGQEVVFVAGRNISATRYSVTGRLNRELWYDEEGVLVQVQFAGADGSEITYILE